MSAFEVSRQYPDLYLRVGHYLNIIDSDYTVTGFAWNSVNNTFDQVFDNPAGPGGATYGVSEYRSLYETWYATLIDSGLDVKIGIARDSATRAQAAYDDALGKASRAKSAADDAATEKDTAEAGANAADIAQQAAVTRLTDAKSANAEADRALDAAEASHSAA